MHGFQPAFGPGAFQNLAQTMNLDDLGIGGEVRALTLRQEVGDLIIGNDFVWMQGEIVEQDRFQDYIKIKNRQLKRRKQLAEPLESQEPAQHCSDQNSHQP